MRLLRALRRSVDVGIRSQQIGFWFSTYGVAGSLASLGIEAGKKGLSVARVPGVKPRGFDAAFGANLARAFAKLGPTFIKLGQILASREDVVGPVVSAELRVLFDRVPPIPYREVKRLLRQEFGTKLRLLIRKVEEKPLASASLSQTHRAELADGTPVILKLQKPGVARTVQADLDILETLVQPLSLLYPKLQLRQMFRDFKEATLREIDYRKEAENIERFHGNYRKLFNTPDVVFPHCYPELTTARVLALEPMRGKKISDLKKGSTVAKHAAEASLTAVLEQIFDHGFFHADPHAGNLFFMEEEGRLGFIDLGLVGKLEPADKKKFLKVVMAVLQRDREKLARHLFDLGEPSKKTDFGKFNADIQKLLDEAKSKGVQALRLDEMIQSLLNIARSNGLHIPNRYVMMMRSCLLIEGVARSLDPDLSLFTVATPVVAKSLMKSYNPLSYLGRWLR
jgi:ubiquinone biosynthesis protein